MTPPGDAGVIRVGLLGCGRIGIVHAWALAGLEGARLSAAADPDGDRLAAVARAFDIRVTSRAEDLIAAKDLDALIVATPTHLHAAQAIAAMRAGKHVLCEKPMAMTVAECDAMLAVATESRVVLMIGHDLRFSPSYRTAKSFVAAGRIGRPLALSAERLSGASGTTWQCWVRQQGEGLGAFDALVHDLDIAFWILGPGDVAGAVGTRGSGGTWDHVQVVLHHSQGATSALEANLRVPATFPFTATLRVVGEEGTLVRRFVGGTTFLDSGTDSGLLLYGRGQSPEVLVPPMADIESNIRCEIDQFLRAIREDGAVQEGGPEDARQAIALVTTIDQILSLRHPG